MDFERLLGKDLKTLTESKPPTSQVFEIAIEGRGGGGGANRISAILERYMSRAY